MQIHFFFLALHVENRDLFKAVFYRLQIENKMYFTEALPFFYLQTAI